VHAARPLLLGEAPADRVPVGVPLVRRGAGALLEAVELPVDFGEGPRRAEGGATPLGELP
jgi:hypothetical protein